MEQSPSLKVKCSLADQVYPAFYGLGKFMNLFTRTLHLSLSWAS